MKMRENGLLKDKRGISPVVATVILVAVTIVVAIAVAYWMGGIAGLYTRFEKLEITSAYSTFNSNPNPNPGGQGNWTVTLNLKNSGSADATIQFVLVNGKPISEYSGTVSVKTSLPLPISTGLTGSITLQIAKGGGFTPGTTIEIKLHSAAGQDYPKTLTLD